MHVQRAQVAPEADDVIEVVVGEQEEHRRLLADVCNEDAQRLQHNLFLCCSKLKR